MGVGLVPTDDSGKTTLALINDANGQVIPVHVGSTVVGADGKTYALLDVHASVTVSGGQAGYVALTSPPANTTANSDTALTFSSQVNHFQIQNNTAANVYLHYESAASLNSMVLLPGAYLREEKPLTVLHVFTVAARPINAQNGLIVEGWL